MNISQTGIDLIKSFEGCRLTAYKPVATEKYWTIGYGHYGPDVKKGQTITQAQAENLLKQDVRSFVNGVNKYVKVNLNQNQFDALVSFSYNLGLGSLSNSTLLKYVNKGDFLSASKEFAKWVKAGGKVLNGLVTRRSKEAALFLKPVTAKKPTVTTPKKEEEKKEVVVVNDKFKPSMQETTEAFSRVLKRFEKKNPPLSVKWRDRLSKGELTEGQAIELLYVAIDRSYIQGSEEKEAVKVTDDITGHWAAASIKKAMSKEVIVGYGEKEFRPNEPLTRAQAAVILDRLGLLD